MSRKILKKASQVGGLALASRCLAFIREFLIIRFLGIGAQSDAFLMAFRVPNSMRKIFAEGALSSVLIPALVKIDKERGNEGVNKLMTASFIVIQSLLFCFCAWVFFYSETLFAFTAPGFNPQQIIYAIKFVKILVSFILFTSASAVLAAALQSKGKFFVPAVAPAVLNVFYIASLIFCLYFGWSTEFFCVCMAITSSIGFLLHLVVYFKHRLSFQLPDAQAIKSFLNMMVTFFPYVVSMSIVEINFMIDAGFSSFLPAGSFSLIGYAFRFVGIPLGVIATSFATVLLPKFSRIGVENKKDLSFNLFEAIKFIIWVTVPMIFLMGLFASEIFETLYSNGPEMVEKIVITRQIFLVFLFGLLPFSLNRVLLNVYYALEKSTIPFVVSIVSCAVNFFMNGALIKFYGASGIAAASVIAAVMQTVVYLFYLYAHLKLEFNMKHFAFFITRSIKQWLIAFSIFFLIVQQMSNFISLFQINISLFFFNLTTDFFLHSFGLWAWVGPIAIVFLLFLYQTRKHFGIEISFLDNK